MNQHSNCVDVRLGEFGRGKEVAEYHLMLSITDEGQCLTYQEQLAAILERFSDIRRDLKASPVFKRYFLSDAANQADELINYELETPEYAVSIVQQAPINGTKVALWCYLMTGVKTKVNPSGLYEVSHGSYRHLWSGTNTNLSTGSESQTTRLLNDYIMQLLHENCTLEANCMRTWFFINDIDNHYHGVVKARNDIFYTQNLTPDTHFVASTGIGGRQANAKALVTHDNYAVSGIKPEQVRYLYATDHLNRTSEYGVSFERGTAIDYGDRRHVFISGTASINNKGEVVHPGDVRKQCERMWENVEALLSEADCTFDDVKEIVCYLRDTADGAVIREMFRRKFASHIPHLIVHAAVCRPGWLIEMECIAVKDIHTVFPCL